MDRRAFLFASLIVGFIISLLSKLPLISICNACLCIWVWSGAILAILLYRQFAKDKVPLTIIQGLLLGLTSGVIAALIGILWGMLFGKVADRFILDLINTQKDFAQSIQPYLREGSRFSLAGLAIDLVFYSTFGMVGGIIGTAIFYPKRQNPAAQA